ncbi:hypothetical protein BD779DRAFT_1675187 [Infundibulicybe gibba]|nr:hypothetical protein BD779DRAFT_1675187 [Infundibulicybe gibba]
MTMLPPFNLPEGILLLITDELPSPADFLLHQSLINHFKESKQPEAIVLSVSNDSSKWKTVAAKNNLNLSNHLLSKSLTLVDILAADPRTEINASQRLVLLDDTASLEWIGFTALDIQNFCRALSALCKKTDTTLIIRHHVVTPDVPDDLFRHLNQLCTYHIDVKPLSSGRSGSVHGEVDCVASGPKHGHR